MEMDLEICFLHFCNLKFDLIHHSIYFQDFLNLLNILIQFINSIYNENNMKTILNK